MTFMRYCRLNRSQTASIGRLGVLHEVGEQGLVWGGWGRHLDEVHALPVQLPRGVLAQAHVKAAQQLQPLDQRDADVPRALRVDAHQVLRKTLYLLMDSLDLKP